MNSIRDRLAALVGNNVDLALEDGTTIDDCQLVSLFRSRRVGTAWIFRNGDDAFVPVDAIIDAWEVRHTSPRAAWSRGAVHGRSPGHPGCVAPALGATRNV
jgi:hypothetical protein